MARLAERPLIKNVTPVPPENLVGDLIQPGHPLFGLVWINRDRVSGAPCFYATRVPIKTLFDSLAGGQTLEFFHGKDHDRLFPLASHELRPLGSRAAE